MLYLREKNKNQNFAFLFVLSIRIRLRVYQCGMDTGSISVEILIRKTGGAKLELMTPCFQGEMFYRYGD